MSRMLCFLALISLFSSGCLSIRQRSGAVDGLVVDAETGEALGRVEVRQGYTRTTPASQLTLSMKTEEDGSFEVASEHQFHFKTPEFGCRLHSFYSPYELHFSRPGYRQVSITIDPKRDQVVVARLARYESGLVSEVESEQEDSAWTTFVAVNATSMEFVTGLPAGVFVGGILVPAVLITMPMMAIFD